MEPMKRFMLAVALLLCMFDLWLYLYQMSGVDLTQIDGIDECWPRPS
jgi:hypothetical protein